MRAIILLATSLLLAVGAAGCGSGTTTTSPSTTTSPTTFTFASQLAVHGSASRSFTTSTAGTVKVTLVTLGNGTQVAGVGLGVPATGAPCSLAQSVVTGPGTSPHIITSADVGTYCVQVFDMGTLGGDTEFAVTVEYP